MQGGFLTGTAQLYIVDPDDVATKVAVKTNVFAATVEMEGGIKFKAGELASANLKITALAKVVANVDATA